MAWLVQDVRRAKGPGGLGGLGGQRSQGVQGYQVVQDVQVQLRMARVGAREFFCWAN